MCLHSLPAALLFRPTSYFSKRHVQNRKMMESIESAGAAVLPAKSNVTTTTQQDQGMGDRLTFESGHDEAMCELSDSMFGNGHSNGKSVCAVCGLPITTHTERFSEAGENSVEEPAHRTLTVAYSKANDEQLACTKLLQDPMCCHCQVIEQRLPTENKPRSQRTSNRKSAVLSCLKSAIFALDFSLFHRPTFRLIFACSVFFPCVDIAVDYLPVLAKENHATEAQAATLLSIVGALDLVCRLGSGLIANTGRVTPATLVQVTFLVLGITYHLVRYLTSYQQLLVLAVLQGLQGGTVNCMIPMLIVDTVGVQHMAKGIGFYQLAAGSFITAVHPLLGKALL